MAASSNYSSPHLTDAMRCSACGAQSPGEEFAFSPYRAWILNIGAAVVVAVCAIFVAVVLSK
jgi:hypothetical protein